MADSRVSISGALTFAWSLLMANWRSVWGVLALTSLAATVYLAGGFADNQDIYWGGLAALWVVSFMSNGAIYRLAFADRHPGDPEFQPGPSGLQWRKLEWRLMGAATLLALFFIIVLLVALVVISGVIVGIAMNRGTSSALATPQMLLTAKGLAGVLGEDGALVVLLLAIVMYFALFFAIIRLSLVASATADSGRIAVLRTWALTRGQFWRIAVSCLLVELPVLFMSGIVRAAGTASQNAITVPDHMAPGPALICGVVMGVLTGGVVTPLLAGVMAYYYRGLKGPPGPAPIP